MDRDTPKRKAMATCWTEETSLREKLYGDMLARGGDLAEDGTIRPDNWRHGLVMDKKSHQKMN